MHPLTLRRNKMKRGIFFDITAIVGLVLHLLSSASDEPKLSPRERARVPPPRSNYKVLSTNMPNRVEAPFTSTNRQERAKAPCVDGRCSCRTTASSCRCRCAFRGQDAAQTREGAFREGEKPHGAGDENRHPSRMKQRGH